VKLLLEIAAIGHGLYYFIGSVVIICGAIAFFVSLGVEDLRTEEDGLRPCEDRSGEAHISLKKLPARPLYELPAGSPSEPPRPEPQP
jgi:hypothetical protein